MNYNSNTQITQHEMSPTMNAKPQCLVCEEEIHDSTPIVLNNCTVCLGCFESNIKPQFAQALVDESSYPVRWSGQDVAIDPVREHFDADFLAKWALVQAERRVLPKDRHYSAGSQCGKFLGMICAEQSIKECPDCQSRSCGVCAALITGPTGTHTCVKNPGLDDGFQELVRGRDYQVCPGCSTPVTLITGCNHMECEVPACSAGFCYICGEPNDHNSGHWETGNACPRYNHPEDANALYDHGGPHAEDDLDGPQPRYHPAWNPDGDPEVPDLFQHVVRDEMDALAAALDPPPNEETLEELFDDAFDVAFFSREMTLVLQDFRETDRLIWEIEVHARDNRGIAERPPPELRNFHHLLHLLQAGVSVYAAHLFHAMERPLGVEWKEMFIRSYDEQIDAFYRDSEQERALWPSIDAIYDRYKLAVAGRMEELMAQAPPEDE